MSSSAVATHGWTAVPRDPSILLEGKRNVHDPVPQKVDKVALPDSPLARKMLQYAKEELNEPTFNHSMRVYYYSTYYPLLLPSFLQFSSRTLS